MRGVVVLIVEVSVSLVLNLTASAYPEQLNPIIPYGWLLVALQITYLLLPVKRIRKRWASKERRRRDVAIGYSVAAILGAVLGIVYWHGINYGLQRLEAAKKARAEAKERAASNAPIEKSPQEATPAPLPPSAKKNEPLTPLVRARSVTALVPFNKDPMRTGIMVNVNLGDPLLATYVDLSGIGRTGPHISSTYEITPITDDEAIDFTADVLRYFVLRSIEELQRPRTTVKLKDGKINQELPTAVPVPDGIQYPEAELKQLLTESKYGLREDHLWNKRFEMPKGAKIRLEPRRVIISKDGEFSLTFDIVKGQKSVGALPEGFVPIDKPANQQDILLLSFNIDMKFQWNNDYSLAQPYSEWAQSLFWGIEKLFKRPMKMGS